MNLRESLNNSPAISITAAILLVVVAVGAITWQLTTSGLDGPRQFYSVDDGATFFEDDPGREVPFEHDGQQAVLAHVYRCGEDGEPFVGYLERTDPQHLELVRKFKQRGAPRPTAEEQRIIISSRQYKKPGDPEWVSAVTGNLTAIRAVLCPDGKPATKIE